MMNRGKGHSLRMAFFLSREKTEYKGSYQIPELAREHRTPGQFGEMTAQRRILRPRTCLR